MPHHHATAAAFGPAGLLALALALCLFVGCTQQAPAPATSATLPADVGAADDEPVDDAPPPLPDDPAPAQNVGPADIIGRFTVSDDVLDLKAVDNDQAKVFDLKTGGRYVFTGGVIVAREEGRWVLEEDGKRLRLTPDKILPESGELLFAVASSDKLLLLNPDGSPANGPFGLVRIVP